MVKLYHMTRFTRN